MAHPWKRFWCPRGGQIAYTIDGFLIDPTSEYAKYYVSDLVAFDVVTHCRCAVFLGEPGIGKSMTLEAEFDSLIGPVRDRGNQALWFDLRDFSSEERLERKIFHSGEILEWREGTQTLDLFLDSLDEGLLRIGNISRVLLSALGELPIERLRLRIASRPAEWPATLEVGFLKLWGQDNVKVLELAP